MKVLVFNCGSSTVKFRLLEIAPDAIPPASVRTLALGLVDRVGGDSTMKFEVAGEAPEKKAAPSRNHEEAVAAIMAWLKSTSTAGEFDVVAHRVVHGGRRFTTAVVIDDSVIDGLEALCELAPLHNPPSLAGIRATKALLERAVPMVAAFDTSFHGAIPDYAASYAIPRELAIKHGIRRYGFHGLAHEYSAGRYQEITGAAKEDVNIITLHLGNGCSACAIRAGESVDTSMGFTPLEGLVMGTRSGDLDPALVAFLAQAEHVDAAAVEDWLNKRSGLLGMSELSSDMRDVVSGYDTNPRAQLAVDVFCYRARKYLGAYLAILGGAEALVFSGGIGENSPFVREKICAGMEWCGLLLDEAQNAARVGTEGCISKTSARIRIFVIPSNEEAVIARQTAMLLTRNKANPSPS
jgi:acetate kinase